jgi:hypothetical protein
MYEILDAGFEGHLLEVEGVMVLGINVATQHVAPA